MRTFFGIIGLMVIGVMVISAIDQQSAPPPAAPMIGPTIVPKSTFVMEPHVELTNLDRSYNVLTGTITLENYNAFPIKDASIICDVVAPSGTVIHTYRFQLFETVPAKGKRLVNKHNFGFWPPQGKSLGCRSTRAVRN